LFLLPSALALAILLTAAQQLARRHGGARQQAAGHGREEVGSLFSRRSAHGAKDGKAFQQAFATLFALEMQEKLGLHSDGPVPPEGGPHELGQVARDLQVSCRLAVHSGQLPAQQRWMLRARGPCWVARP
jgi:hypothetical protein